MRFLSLVFAALLFAAQPIQSAVHVGWTASTSGGGGGAVNYGNETTGGVLLSTDAVNVLYLYPVNESVTASGTLQSFTVNVRASTATRKLIFALYKSDGSGGVNLVSGSYTDDVIDTSTPAYTAAADFDQLSFTPQGTASITSGDYYIGMRGTGYPKVAGTASGGSGYTTTLASSSAWPTSLTLSSLTASAYIPGKWYITVEL